MPLGVYSITALAKKDASGLNIVKEAAVTVKDVTNTTTQTIYSDLTGLSTISQPAETDANGNFDFVVEAGRYAATVGGVTKIIEVFASTDQLVSVARTASWTLDATMNGGFSYVTGTATIVVTIPKEATTNLSLTGNRVWQHTVAYKGDPSAGTIEVDGEDGTVTIVPLYNLALTASTQYRMFTIMKMAHDSNTWWVVGNTDSLI